MGVVYKARDRELNRIVALKMIRQKLVEDPGSIERFRREPGLAQQVTHENVCRVHDLGVYEDVRYLSMEYLEANTLAQLIAKLGRLSVRQALTIATQVARGLEAIHGQGIVHRDLKPSNVALDASSRAVVMDFGLARGPVDTELTEPGVLVGSYAYLAPEHIRGHELTVAVDIYALGLLVYEMLAGRRPPGDDDRRPLALRGPDASCPPPSTFEPDVPPQVDELVMRCLSWDAADRPSSIDEILPILENASEAEESRTERHGLALRSQTRRRRWWGRIAVAAALAGATLFWTSTRTRPESGPSMHLVSLASFDYEGDEPDGSFVEQLANDAMTASLNAAPYVRVLPAAQTDLHLAGSVSQAEPELQWHLSLVDADDRVRWEDSVSGVAPLDAIQELLDALFQEGLGLEAPTALSTLRTADIDAYRDYLEARSLADAWYPTTEEAFDRSRALFQSALRRDPEFAAAHAWQAMVSTGAYLRSGGDGDKAVAQYAASRSLAFGRALPESHLASGVYFAAIASWDEAARAFDRTVELAPYDDSTHRDIADLYLTLGRTDDAHAMFLGAISRQPNAWRNYFAYGRSLFLAGELDPALFHLGKAIEINPRAEDALTLLGFHYLSVGDLLQARTFYQRAVAVSDDVDASHALGLVSYFSGDFSEALRFWTEVLEERPQVGIYHADVGDALRQLGRSDEATARYLDALSLLDASLRDEPTNVERAAERAQVLAALGRCDEARTQMEQALVTRAHDTQYQYYGALTAGRCGFVDWAVELVLPSIGGGHIVGIQFDPDLEPVRHDPRVLEPLRLIGLEE